MLSQARTPAGYMQAAELHSQPRKQHRHTLLPPCCTAGDSLLRCLVLLLPESAATAGMAVRTGEAGAPGQHIAMPLLCKQGSQDALRTPPTNRHARP